MLVVSEHLCHQFIVGGLVSLAQQHEKRCILGATPGRLHAHSRPGAVCAGINDERISTGEVGADAGVVRAAGGLERIHSRGELIEAPMKKSSQPVGGAAPK